MKKLFLVSLLGILSVISLEAGKRRGFCSKCQFVPATVVPVVTNVTPQQPIKRVSDIEKLIVASQTELTHCCETLHTTEDQTVREQLLTKIQTLEKKIVVLIAQKIHKTDV